MIHLDLSDARVTLVSGVEPRGDLIFVSTDSAGTPGMLNEMVLRSLGEKIDFMPDELELVTGYALKQSGDVQVCFVVTVGTRPTAVELSENLTRALLDPRLQAAKLLWIPLMGTGAGGLAPAHSLSIAVDSLRKAQWIAREDRSVVISLPPALTDVDSDPELGAVIDRIREEFGPVPDVRWTTQEYDFGLPISPATSDALRFAAAIRRKRSNDGRTSVRSLLFALAESRSPLAANSRLATDLPAGLFAAAVHDLAEGRYEEAFNNYVPAAKLVGDLSWPAALPALTKNMTVLMKRAVELARINAAHSVGTDELIQSLMEMTSSRLSETLAELNISFQQLRDDYDDMRTGQIVMSLHNDVAATKDELGYAVYGEAIRQFLLHASTPPPLSISIQAPWGAGKSSLMQIIREKLDPSEHRAVQQVTGGGSAKRLTIRDVVDYLSPTGRSACPEPALAGGRDTRFTIWFNAWKYETSEQIWAGLVDAIVSQVAERLPRVNREKFLLRLHLSRIDDGIVRQRIYNRVVSIWWNNIRRWVLLGAAGILSLLGLGAGAPHLPATIAGAAGTLSAFGYGGALATQLLLSGFAVWTYFLTQKRTRDEPADFSLSDFIRVPDYNRAAGEIHQIHADLCRVLEVVPQGGDGKHAPVVIFIDDLDRCSPGNIASVVEGVSMLLASDTYRCIFVIGMDPQLIAAALEKAHEEVRERLPTYERSVPLGWRFMDKFVQLPFTIPPPRQAGLDRYLLSLGAAAPRTDAPTGAATSEPPAEGATEPVMPSVAPAADVSGRGLPLNDEAAPVSSAAAEARDVGKIIRLVAERTSGNPREVKRMVNLARLYLALRDTRRALEPTWRWPSLENYARWIVLTLRWPDMMRWLQWGSDEVAWTIEEGRSDLIARRLRRLEETAIGSRTGYEWRSSISEKLGLAATDEIDWTADRQLLEFFRREAETAEHKSLAAAAEQGFW